jgi:ornithine carbamoyltransferase
VHTTPPRTAEGSNTMQRPRHFLSLAEMGADEVAALIATGLEIARGHIAPCLRLDGKVVGLFFRGPSTRTRTAFGAGALRLGGSIMQYGPNDLQLVTGESPADTGRVLSSYLDALVVRTNGADEELRSLAAQPVMPVINAMSASEHPTQAIGDLITIQEVTGGLSGRTILYLGEGNNTASSLAFAVALTPGMRLVLMTPPRYGLNPDLLARAMSIARVTGAEISQEHNVDRLPRRADIVYTTRWETMGVPHQDPDWRHDFAPYKVTQALFDRVRGDGTTYFMHDLPAVREVDCDSAVLDGPYSVAFRQARHKMTAAMAILGRCVGRAA